MLILVIASHADGAMYRWEDDQGTVFFTDDLEKVPESYRRRVKKEASGPLRRPFSPQKRSDNRPNLKALPRFEQKTDRFGKEKQWWRDLKKRWEKKKKKAEDQIALIELEMRQLEAHTTMPEEKREQEARRMRKQFKTARIQRDAAIRMLTVGIPEEARQAGAPPEWISDRP